MTRQRIAVGISQQHNGFDGLAGAVDAAVREDEGVVGVRCFEAGDATVGQVKGGAIEGQTLESTDPAVTINAANDVALSYRIAATVCISIIAIGNGVFALHLGWMILDWLRLRVRGNKLASELLVEPYEGDVAPVPKQEAAA